MSSLTAFVFARGGSKGLPGKNIRPLAGKPLIGHAANGLFAGRVGGVVLPRERAVDIDDLTDFRIAEALWPRP